MSTNIRIANKGLKTPKLRIKWVGLGAPYFYNEADTKGSYSVTLAGTPEEMQDWVDDMEAICEDLYEQGCKQAGSKLRREDPFHPIANEFDKDTGEDTGRFQVKLKHNAKGFNGKTGTTWEIKPKVFDALGKPVPQELITKIGRDSLVRCKFDAVTYLAKGKFGVKFELVATQLIQPVWFVSNEEAAKFDEEDIEEGGFSVEEGAEF